MHGNPSKGQEVMIRTNLNWHYLRLLSHKFHPSRSSIYFRRNLNDVSFSFYFEVKIKPPLGSNFNSWFEQTLIYTSRKCLFTSFHLSDKMVLEDKICIVLINIFLCHNLKPHIGPIQPPGIIIWTNLNLTTWGRVFTRFYFSCLIVFKNILNDFYIIFLFKNICPCYRASKKFYETWKVCTINVLFMFLLKCRIVRLRIQWSFYFL